ncbi:hypothetical protein ACFQZZ_30970 [Nocardia sp. GCM10030253]|uniref:hypothetical protein n=1 Tax=Nocardia sp. GCM10030253 TaxID=3273404 RepID=UPI0036353161
MSDANVDDILNVGAWGLQYWIRFMPEFKKAFPDHDVEYSVSDLEAMYDQQRGMNLVKLTGTADALKQVVGVVDEQIARQRAVLQRLPAVWSGNASQAAQQMIGDQLRYADEDRKKLQGAIDAIRVFVPDIRTAVEGKAEYTLALLEPIWITSVEIDGKTAQNIGSDLPVVIDGKTPEDVAYMIDIKNAETWISYDQICWVYDHFPETREALDNGYTHTDGKNNLVQYGMNGEIAQNAVKRWLDVLFKDDFTKKLTGFVDKCRAVDEHVKTQYQTLQASLGQLDQDSYPRPAGEPDKPSTPAGTNPTTPAGTNPTTPAGTNPTTPAGTNPTTPAGTNPTTPVSTNPTSTINPLQGLASLSQVASTLSPLATQLASAATQGLTALSGTIKEGLDQALQQIEKTLDPKQAEDKDGDGKPDEQKLDEKKDGKPAAEFDLAGKHLKFEMGLDGQLKAVVTDADGKAHEYSVKLDEKGNPVISTGGSEGEDGKPLFPQGGNPGSPPGNPGNSDSPGTPGSPAGPGGSASPPAENPNQAGVPTGAPPLRREEDGEHRPAPMPAPDGQEPPPFESGAELAEAGPL